MQGAPNSSPGSATLRVPDAAAAYRWSPGAPGGAESDASSLSSLQWASRDPRTSSTQSLAPSTDEHDSAGGVQKRKLLVVYIHGFMGDKSSFRSFPAHVHGFLKDLLAETHVIHTKIYPRYKTYKSIDVACDNFSKWLAPHESPTTDVVLVGHSMGGLLAAEVVLLV
jgi:pimeloyl-ACP methyl ester carboxylesterase